MDLQKSQLERFRSLYPEATLFPNVRARLVSIDGLDIQKELENEKPKLDREFTREFNLTYRTDLLRGEELQGKFDASKKGEVSLEEDFAKRLGASLGSWLVVNIQGFDLETTVTSIRKVDTRSGLPFFFLVFSPEDLEKYPNTSFGYLDIPSQEIASLSKKLSVEFPNVSLVDTSTLAEVTESIVSILLVVILIITLPPIVLATLLIINIIISLLSQDRKRDGARLMALGKTKKYLRNFFIFESVITLVISSLSAYIFALLVSNFLVVKYLDIDSLIYFDILSFYIFASLLLGVIITSILIWRRGKRSIKDYLNYEENY